MDEHRTGPATLLSPQDMHADLDQLVRLYERVHPAPVASFPLRSPCAALLALKENLAIPCSRLDFYRRLAPLVNGTGDEHTHLMLFADALAAYAAQGGLFFPGRVEIVDGRVYAASPASDGTDRLPAGAELLAIDARPMTDILRVLEGFFSGTCTRQKDFFVETSFAEALYLAFGAGADCKVTYTAAEGDPPLEVLLPGLPLAAGGHTSAFPILNESPLRFRSDNTYRKIGEKTLLFEFRAFENPNGELKRLLFEMFALARKEGIETLLVDLRRNIGGNSFAAALLLDYLAEGPYELLESSALRASAELKRHFLGFIPPLLRLLGVQHLHPWTRRLWRASEGDMVTITFKPQRLRPGKQAHFSGKVIFLSGPGDYSSSAILLGAVKHYRLGEIVGEASGGYPTHYGNCTVHFLEHSRLEVLVPASVNYGKGLGPVLPDYEIRPAPADIAAGRDAVLEGALRMVHDTISTFFVVKSI